MFGGDYQLELNFGVIGHLLYQSCDSTVLLDRVLENTLHELKKRLIKDRRPSLGVERTVNLLMALILKQPKADPIQISQLIDIVRMLIEMSGYKRGLMVDDLTKGYLDEFLRFSLGRVPHRALKLAILVCRNIIGEAVSCRLRTTLSALLKLCHKQQF